MLHRCSWAYAWDGTLKGSDTPASEVDNPTVVNGETVETFETDAPQADVSDGVVTATVMQIER